MDRSPGRPQGLTQAGRLAALALAAVAIGVRVFGLGRESLWLDEGATWRMVTRPMHGIVEAARTDVHPPLFFLVERLVTSLAGQSEAPLRLVSALASILSVPLAARLAWRAFGPRAAWGAAVLVALSAYQVSYAQEARPYALLGLLALASAESLLAVLAGGGAPAAVAWALATTALLYTHAHAVFVVLAELVAVAWWLRRPGGRRPARALLAPAAFVALAFAPWLGVLGTQVTRVASGFWIARPGPVELVRTFVQFAGSVPLAAALGLLALAAIAPSRRAAIAPRRDRPARRAKHAAPEPARPAKATPPAVSLARLLVVSLALVPLLAPFALSFVGPPIYLSRAAFAASLALALLAAGGWARLPRVAGRVVGALVVAACLPPLVDVHRLTWKEPWRDAVRWLESRAQPGDLVLVTAPYYRDGVFAYYHRPGGLEIRAVPDHDGPFTSADADSLAPALAGHPRAFLVRARADDPDWLLPAALAAGHRVVAHREWDVTPPPPSRPRPVRALDVICYAAPDSSAPSNDPPRPTGR